MSQKHIVTCDECGAERKEANHWFSLLSSPTSPRLSTFDDADRSSEPSFRLDYCGQRCYITAIQRWLDTGTVIDSHTTRPSPIRQMRSPEAPSPYPAARLLAMQAR
jgi:endogenous inhibitor of DNA gyrase (YacG/DUF329 family)